MRVARSLVPLVLAPALLLAGAPAALAAPSGAVVRAEVSPAVAAAQAAYDSAV
ncbi:MAG: hypothetical protein JWM64_2863, partial [Frankiales bacterium]|nr:hypothetical protein [Frankiales bacterium]